MSWIEIERPGNKLRVIIKTARPGIIIGRKGAEIDKLKQDVQKRTAREVYIDIQEVHKPELDAQLVSELIALQLEKRVGFRRAMRKAVDSALRFWLQGNQGAGQRTSERQRNRAFGVVPAGPSAAAHPARRHRLWFYRSTYHLWRDRGEVLGLQRRNFAGQKARAAASRRVLKVWLEAKS